MNEVDCYLPHLAKQTFPMTVKEIKRTKKLDVVCGFEICEKGDSLR